MCATLLCIIQTRLLYIMIKGLINGGNISRIENISGSKVPHIQYPQANESCGKFHKQGWKMTVVVWFELERGGGYILTFKYSSIALCCYSLSWSAIRNIFNYVPCLGSSRMKRGNEPLPLLANGKKTTRRCVQKTSVLDHNFRCTRGVDEGGLNIWYGPYFK